MLFVLDFIIIIVLPKELSQQTPEKGMKYVQS